MDEWLVPGKRPIWDTTHPEMPFADCNWAPKSKEDEMSKKNAAQTTIDLNENTESKEDTAMKNEQTAAANNTEKKENAMPKYNYREDKARHAEIRAAAKLGRTKPIEGITSCLPGKTAANFTDDPEEVKLLGKAAAKFGWGNEFCTVSQAAKFFGTLDPEYTGHGWLVKYKPYTPKSGKNAGKTSQFETVVYPKEAFIWNTESGEPELDEQGAAMAKAKRAKRAANRAAKNLKAANAAAGIKTPRKKATKKTSTKKAAPKVDVPNIDMDAALNAAIEKLVSEKLAEAVAKALANAS